MSEKEQQIIPSVPRESVATPEQARAHLEITPDKEKDIRTQQAKALKVFRSKARLTPAEFQRGRGVELERHHRITGNQNALAEALAMQGRFHEAALAADDPALTAVLTEKAEAIDRPDENCDCPD
jgi:hypothetical protein